MRTEIAVREINDWAPEDRPIYDVMARKRWNFAHNFLWEEAAAFAKFSVLAMSTFAWEQEEDDRFAEYGEDLLKLFPNLRKLVIVPCIDTWTEQMTERRTKAFTRLLKELQVKTAKATTAWRLMLPASEFRMPEIAVDKGFLDLSARMSRWRVGGPF